MNEFEKAVRDALSVAARRGGTGPENYATANAERVAADLRAALAADDAARNAPHLWPAINVTHDE